MGTKNLQQMSEGDARNYVEKHLLYEHTKDMRLITPNTIAQWIAYKARIIRQKVNAALTDSTFRTDEETEDAIRTWKGR